jgi:hypothetical protein
MLQSLLLTSKIVCEHESLCSMVDSCMRATCPTDNCVNQGAAGQRGANRGPSHEGDAVGCCTRVMKDISSSVQIRRSTSTETRILVHLGGIYSQWTPWSKAKVM